MDPKVAAITQCLARSLEDMLAHGYQQTEAVWEWRRAVDHKLLDAGRVRVRRGKDGAFLVRITDRFTGEETPDERAG